MNFQKTPIQDVVLIEPQVFGDARGFFLETWQAQRFAAAGITAKFVQDNQSRSTQWTLRGLHFQSEHTQGKLVRVTAGAVFDVVVDLRRHSPTFGAWWGVELSAENHCMLWVPEGLAHGILVTSESADFLYKCTDVYSPAHEKSLAWDDSRLGIRWPLPAGIHPETVTKRPAWHSVSGHRDFPMRVLVLGGGQIATAVTRVAPEPHQVVVRTRAELDIVDAAAIASALAEVNADWVINAAAYTAVDRAEDDRAEANAVNDVAVGSLAESAARENSRLLHLSTDFVFDGQSNRAYLPNDRTNPLSVYGTTKLAGERHVTASPVGVVLRTSWVYASAGKNFVLTMLRLMKEREQISVVNDQIGTPTWAVSAATAIWALIEANVPGGIYHWADLGIASWYDFAVAIQDEALERGLLTRVSSVLPISSAAYPTRAKRPSFSVLDTSATRSMVPISARHWRHNLRTMLDEIRTA